MKNPFRYFNSSPEIIRLTVMLYKRGCQRLSFAASMASRAERLLVIAAPKSQAERLAAHLRGQGAAVTVKKI